MYMIIDRYDGGSSSITSSDHAHCEDDGSSPFATFLKRNDKSYRISSLFLCIIITIMLSALDMQNRWIHALFCCLLSVDNFSLVLTSVIMKVK